MSELREHEIECPACGRGLSWLSDSNLSEITDSDSDEIVGIYECTNKACRVIDITLKMEQQTNE